MPFLRRIDPAEEKKLAQSSEDLPAAVPPSVYPWYKLRPVDLFAFCSPILLS